MTIESKDAIRSKDASSEAFDFDRDGPGMAVGGFTFSKTLDMQFVRSVADAVVPVIQEFAHLGRIVSGYTPLWAKGDQAILVLQLHDNGNSRACVGITFNEPSEDGSIVRRHFDPVAWSKNPDAHMAADICTANLDEAWMLLCTIGQRLDLGPARLFYGA